MAAENSSKDEFLYPKSSYWGKASLQNITFNSNLQEFAQRVSFVCNLETGGKVTSEEAYQQIKSLWKQLKTSKKNLLDVELPDIGQDDLPDTDGPAS